MAANMACRNASDGFPPAESKARASERPKQETVNFRPDTGGVALSFEGEWGHGMKAQGTKLQATENDLKRLMADVTRAMEKLRKPSRG